MAAFNESLFALNQSLSISRSAFIDAVRIFTLSDDMYKVVSSAKRIDFVFLRAFDRSFGGETNVPSFKLVVDAGCGTGLVGEQFRNVSQYLVGADLSPSIIAEAVRVRPNLYNETKVGDVTDVFREMKPIDLIIAADSYIYFGDLNPLFQSMNEGLIENGYIAFTLENPSKDNQKR